LGDNKTKLELLDSIYSHIEETDWLEGLDLYQGGKVQSANQYHGLITGRVAGSGTPSEVRIKIHPAGHCIQWIECTCRKNRLNGRYCEHIAAVMLHIDREQAELVAQLDSKMPLKPPSVKKARGSKKDENAHVERKAERVTENILTQLKGAIASVNLIAGGPGIRVRLEIKEGQLTHYDLSVDDAGSFLESRPDIENATKEAQNLRVCPGEAELGFVVTKLGQEEIGVERCVVFPEGFKRPKKTKANERLFTINAVRLCAERDPSLSSKRLIMPLKGFARFIGGKYVFVPEAGYVELSAAHAEPTWHDLPITQSYVDDEAAELIQKGFAELLQYAPVIVDDKLYSESVISMPSITTIEIRRAADGWFTLDPRYGEGRDMVSLGKLLTAYRKNKRKYLKSGKSWIEIPDYLRDLDWQVESKGNSVKLNAIGLLRLKAMVGDLDAFVGSKSILDAVRTKVDPTSRVEPPTLKHTNLDLRSYQQEGYEWFWWLYSNGLHGLLADEMGLGKTHQAMALMSGIQAMQPSKSFLVISPTTVLDHWNDKIVQYCPNLNPIKFHGPKRIQDFLIDKEQTKTFITSYGVILRDISYFEKVQWGAVILDEAHAIKNNDTATYKAVCRLQSDIRICLSGTPMENHLSELKNVFDFIVPGYLGSDAYFKEHFVKRIHAERDAAAEKSLQKLIYPLKLRRNKSQVLKDLPEKVEDRRRIPLSDEQARLYREILELRARPLINQLRDDGSPIPYLHVFATLTLLKQVCNHPALVLKDPNYKKHESSKLELLKELLDEALGSEHKVVIYSQYIEMINIICAYLKEADIQFSMLTGQTRNRGQVIKDFQSDPNIKVFVGSLLAGGIGIDLTAASVVIHYDRWWNASKENQATDRVHRIGQTKNVQVLKLICKGTLEEKIDRMIQSKQNLFERFVDQDEEVFKQFSRQELIELLE
jgi:superfamily II DNA or RNA helicase